MERIYTALAKLEEINKRYEIPGGAIERIKINAKDAKVCTPIIGKFSTGKSALVNALLGYSKDVFKEDITLETAIPAEVVYTDGDEKVTIIERNGAQKTVSVDEYRSFKADANTVKCARLHLHNSVLKEMRDVMLVDMPGFDSGFEMHNKAIDEYVSQSLVYIITFPADDMIIRSSIGSVIKELCHYDMPLCVVITKCDKRNDEFDETLAKLIESIKRYIGDREITYCTTSSRDGEVGELKDFLKIIQDKSQVILEKSFKSSLLAAADNSDNYLNTTVKSIGLSESELDEQEEKLKKQLSDLDSRFLKEQSSFESEISVCTDEIRNDVQYALEAEEPTFIAIAMNNQSINEQLNNVVRNAVATGVKKRFIPKVDKYLKRVEKCIDGDSIGNVHATFNFGLKNLDNEMTSSVVSFVAYFLPRIPGPLRLLIPFIAFVLSTGLQYKCNT